MHLAVVSSPPATSEDSGLELLLVAGGAALCLLGAILGCAATAVAFVCCRGKDTPCGTPSPGAARRWEILVKKALFFVGRRRRLSLAVGAYRFSDLRESASSRPNQARARRRALRAAPEPLREGPAIRPLANDGPHRG